MGEPSPSDLSFVTTDELISEIIRRHLRTVVILEKECDIKQESPEDLTRIIIEFGGPEGEEDCTWMESWFAIHKLMLWGLSSIITILKQRNEESEE